MCPYTGDFVLNVMLVVGAWVEVCHWPPPSPLPLPPSWLPKSKEL